MIKNYKDKITQKKGISMVTLIITIVVATILASAGIVTVSNSIFDATLTAFANDLNTIQDQVKLYYIQNDEFPVFNLETAFSQGDIINLVSANGNSSEFEEELSLNGDFNDNSALGAFYKIDLSKLNVEKTSRGTKQDGDESDIYVVSYPSMNVYYLKGIKVKNVKYYSLSSKIVKYVKVADNASDDTSVTDLTTVGNISVKKLNKTWTNKLGINLNTYLNSGESLYINFGTEYKFNTTVGNNIFIFDTFADLKSKLEVSDETVYNETVNNFIASTDKKINIYIKDSSGTQLDKMEIDLNNYDIVAPIANNWNIVENSENNILTFNVADINSGVKEVRYDYLQKYNEYGELEKYYTGVDSLDPYFLKARGKKSKVSKDGNVEISLPKEIEGIQIIVIDKAGNISLVTDEDGSQIPITKAIPTNIFIGSTLKSINSSGLKFKLAINISNTTTSGILSSYTIQYSTDGDNYSSAITKTPTSSTNPYTEIITDYQTGLTITDSIYIKVKVTTTKNVEKEVIVRHYLDEKISDEEVEIVEGVTIPKGFEHVEGTTVSTGYVIKNTTDGNEFVWVPVNDISNFIREEGYLNGSLQSYVQSCREPYETARYTSERDEYDAMIASVSKYGGFYIGRYEASKSESGVAQSLKDKAPWYDIAWGNSMTDVGTTGAVAKARAVYPDSATKKEGEAISTLPYGVQWDATVRFLKTNYPGIEKDSTGYGNYSRNEINTGSNPAYALNNIYDIAGNYWEWTMEANSDYCRVNRGGFYYYPGSKQPVSGRNISTVSDNPGRIGFRLALYIK